MAASEKAKASLRLTQRSTFGYFSVFRSSEITSGPFFQVQQVQLNQSGMIKSVVQEASLKAEKIKKTPQKIFF